MTTIELGGVTFHDAGTSGWIFNSLKDWYGVPQSKAAAEPIPQQHGSFDPGIDWRSSVVPSFNAVFLGETEGEALAAFEALAAVGTSDAQQVMSVTDPLRMTSREVSVRGITLADHHGASILQVAIDLLAADPLRYGADVVATTGLPSLSGGLAFPIVFPIDFASTGDSGRLVTVNAGTQATYSRFVVTGAMAGGFSLISVEDAREIRFEFPLALADVVTIDPRSGRAWINDESNSLTGFLTRSEWWSVPAGGSRQVQFNSIGSVTGTPTLTAYTPPAYL